MAEDPEETTTKAQEVLKAIKKQAPNVSIHRASDPEVQVQVLSTGIPLLDELMRGIKRGGHTFLYGPNKVGKTTLAGRFVAAMQAAGLRGLFIDHENRLDPLWWKLQGVDLDLLDILVGGDDFEEDMDAAFALIRQGIYQFLVVDSITGKPARGEMQDKAGKGKSFTDDTVALLARKLSEWFRKVGPALGRLKIPVIELSQVRATNLHAGAYLDMSGGNAAKHWASTILKLSRGPKITATKKGEKLQLGYWLKIELKKTSICPNEGKSIQMPFYFGIGIDDIAVAVRAGIEQGLIKKGATSRVEFAGKSYVSENQLVETLRLEGGLADQLILDLSQEAPQPDADPDPEVAEGTAVDESQTEDGDEVTYREEADGKFSCLIEGCGEVKDSLRGLRIHQGKAHKS